MQYLEKIQLSLRAFEKRFFIEKAVSYRNSTTKRLSGCLTITMYCQLNEFLPQVIMVKDCKLAFQFMLIVDIHFPIYSPLVSADRIVF